jgi:hypothetical protein
MAVTKPYKRTCRPFLDGKYPDGRSSYISDPKFATAPQQHIRAFEVIQKDLLELFDYVEPADKNEGCYSFRIHELHMRTCIELESNSKAARRRACWGTSVSVSKKQPDEVRLHLC